MEIIHRHSFLWHRKLSGHLDAALCFHIHKAASSGHDKSGRTQVSSLTSGACMRRVLLIEEHEEPLSRKQEMKIAIQYKNSSLLIPMRWKEKVLRSQTTETLLLIRFLWIPSIALDLLDGLLRWKADSKSQCSFYSWISTSINNGIIDNKPELIKVISFLQLQLDQC